MDDRERTGSAMSAARSPGELDRRAQRLVASWERSQAYGVARAGIAPAFTGRTDDDSLFAACGLEVLTQLQQTLVDEPISLMLVDPDGLVLKRLSGDRSLLRALDAVHLAPGFSYSEREAGTNGLALALADRAPSLVRHDEHYAVELDAYTCAAVPVLDPASGRLEGAVNLTTRAAVPPSLLLALAQSAAGNTSALMLARSSGRRPRPAPRGHVFRVQNEPGCGTAVLPSPDWTEARANAEHALATGRTVVAVGEPGSGRTTLLSQALRQALPQHRVLCASTPAPDDVDAWLALWAPELGKPHTAVVVRDVDGLPAWAAERLCGLLRAPTGGAPPVVALTVERFEDLPPALVPVVDTVVPLAPLRERPADVLPLAQHVAHRVRGRDLTFTPAASRALTGCGWPGGAAQLVAAVRAAAGQTETVDVRHLPADVRGDGGRLLSRMEALERDEIARVLARPGTSVGQAAQQLGLSRATLYRRLAQYGLQHGPA